MKLLKTRDGRGNARKVKTREEEGLQVWKAANLGRNDSAVRTCT
jgi:hypothetical protein